MAGFGKLLNSLGGFGRLWLEHSMSLTEALGGFGKFWEPLGSFGSGMLWKVWQPGFGPMDALEGFGGFRSL